MKSASAKEMALFVVFGLLAVGCNRTTEVRSQGKSSSDPQPPAYLKCIGEFIEYEADYPWFENWVEENGTEMHGDGAAPRAVFRISSPANYADRTVGIVYKYTGDDLPPPPPLSKKGKEFSFEVPEDFFTGEYGAIDNLHIRNFRAAP